MPVVAKPVIPVSVVCATDDIAAPIKADEFAVCMQRLGPFEGRPQLAVGVSGGRDSLALVLLAGEWAAARGGRVTAVTVDHGLRAASAAEAAQVSAWMEQYAIPHHTLAWQDSPGLSLEGADATAGASEAAARSARYALLEAFCKDREILHLLVGHHREDQLETQAMRRARSSGALGRAGMPAVRELPHVRVLRPFLDIPRTRITETLRTRGQIWIEDPSNQDTRFARARLRAVRPAVPASGLGEDMARVRVALERSVARLAVQAITVHPAGYATLNPALLDTADRETGIRLIANLVTCIGGRAYAPRGPRLTRLADRLIDGGLGGGATLSGCIVRSDSNGMVRVMREQAAIEPPRHVTDDIQAMSWDGRFQLLFPATDSAGMDSDPDRKAQLGAVGCFSALGVPVHSESPRYEAMPHAIRMTLPAIYRDGYYHICTMPFSAKTGHVAVKAWFAPKNPVAGAVFATS